MTQGRIVLVRHGQTQWSRSGRHTGLSDIPLTAEGEAAARSLGPVLAALGAVRPVLCLASPLQRADRTARLAGLDPATEPALVERSYGHVEGLTTAQVREATGDPAWDVWDDELQGTPVAVVPPPDAYDGPGESLAQVADRLAPLLERCGEVVAAGEDCVLVAHSHLLRILAGCWLGLGPGAGRHLVLDAGHLAVLGCERTTPAVLAWNLAPVAPDDLC